MKKYIKLMILALMLSSAWNSALEAQEFKQISLALLNESISFPLNSFSEIHPGVELGFPIRQVEKDHSVRTINSYAGWFLHKHIENSFYVRAEYMHEFKVGSYLRAGFYGGAGYMHAFYEGTMYEVDPETGAINAVKQYGRPRALISAGIVISANTEAGINPFLKHEYAVETPFANGVPVMPHSFLKLGLTINL